MFMPIPSSLPSAVVPCSDSVAKKKNDLGNASRRLPCRAAGLLASFAARRSAASPRDHEVSPSSSGIELMPRRLPQSAPHATKRTATTAATPREPRIGAQRAPIGGAASPLDFGSCAARRAGRARRRTALAERSARTMARRSARTCTSARAAEELPSPRCIVNTDQRGDYDRHRVNVGRTRPNAARSYEADHLRGASRGAARGHVDYVSREDPAPSTSMPKSIAPSR